MSFSISIHGSKAHESPDDARAFEQQTAAKAREFVKSLDGVNVAHSSHGQLPSQNLMEDE